MSRTKQRENKKMKIAEEKIEKRNSHGHLDLTAYEAVKNIIQKEKQKQR